MLDSIQWIRRASQSARNPAQTSDPNPSDLEQCSSWTHGTVDPAQTCSFLLFTVTVCFFLTDVWTHECALLTRLLCDLLWWYSRMRFSRLLQSILSHSSFSFPLIPTWLTGRTQPTPAPSSSIHTQAHTYTLLPVPSEWTPLESRSRLWPLAPG